MILERTSLSRQHAASRAAAELETKQEADGQRPLTCMFYFFASQMKQNVQPPDQDLVRRGKLEDKPTHQLDSMIARLAMHAAFSPLISKFETYPVEIPNTAPASARQKNRTASREQVHDSVMIMKFRDKRARQEWIATKEWQDFMRETEGQQVFRRMPHVRCASSLRGLMDPMDILTA
ncbi:uncharacterized protein Z520_06288 [Fonsecaea multimorphosa CBS 102226]|uniref:Uncharacterized protein n=1 Tax=Fonsecaea multimorphosa CBS 102226 TaxID=1442371 RepID=A0A0D2KNA6_9EURO|nr:uncharacterized protein Z520_06288 [Fonsecaea multimorphosa CBS 102226]KIX98208.1 hypothetical protein Z520_06288 [Fonsecaea multimorphosa CBS 102226]OAL22655.1 hypothetical protein AYO22_07214 [Fonsecaea multimorphosa]